MSKVDVYNLNLHLLAICSLAKKTFPNIEFNIEFNENNFILKK